MNPLKASSRVRTRFGIKSIFVATTVVGILLHVAISIYTRSFAMLGVNLALFYAGSGIALTITAMAVMTLGKRAAFVGAVMGATAWGLLLSTIHFIEPAIEPYIPRHVVVFAAIVIWMIVVSASTNKPNEV